MMNVTMTPVKNRNNRLLRKRMLREALLCILPAMIGALIIALSRLSGAATERIYSRAVFEGVSWVVSLPGRLVSWSLASLVLTAGIVLIAGALIWFVYRLVRRRMDAGLLWRCAKAALAVPSAVLLIFALTCAPNYNRLTFTELSGLELRPAPVGELVELCAWLIGEAGESGADAARKDGVMALPDTLTDTARLVRQAFDGLSRQYPHVGRARMAPKPFAASEILSYLNLTGFYFPYTGEANFNAHMPDLEIPFTMGHELAHTRGFMREEEANFIAYLTGRDAESPELRYSAAVCALSHCSDALYRVDPDAYFALRAAFPDELEADLAHLNAYWQKYRTPIAEVSNTVNDLYLKANNQSDGTHSYGRMVDLMLADYRTRHADD